MFNSRSGVNLSFVYFLGTGSWKAAGSRSEQVRGEAQWEFGEGKAEGEGRVEWSEERVRGLLEGEVQKEWDEVDWGECKGKWESHVINPHALDNMQ